MADDDDIVLLACAMAVAAAALAIKDELIDDDPPDRKPQLRFMRPETSYLDYLDMQRDLLHDRGDRVIYDIFRMDDASLHVLVAMAKPYLPGPNGFYGEDINDPRRLAASCAAFATKDPSLGACIGAIDGTHIPVVVPVPMSERYRNRYAILVLASSHPRYPFVIEASLGAMSLATSAQPVAFRFLPADTTYCGLLATLRNESLELARPARRGHHVPAKKEL
ncbi:hypothetical protein SDRG_12591 [Saprolegnia diclina VS20]|uniref:DDE Tnp4 domain-containing protein n=1 Tax=Saprolegnia diclina (strain VS20) TaxID=1156394 RepID=T0RIC6_SAPDV|nr:hypothetical protein SDRG_12591 [Saprolegnia diclina VS20]EQC29582.1 hypothetical protein SDRG_12591 [Saprolegnia diclina VS20]|eukprot:XP_008616886.1 hypothetical protein SDRG_12591 [Saprolegnia diclina VS20]